MNLRYVSLILQTGSLIYYFVDVQVKKFNIYAHKYTPSQSHITSPKPRAVDIFIPSIYPVHLTICTPDPDDHVRLLYGRMFNVTVRLFCQAPLFCH